MNVFLRASSDKMELVLSEYFTAVADALHTVVMEISRMVEGYLLAIELSARCRSSFLVLTVGK
jgi:hypothetical protein